MTTQDATALARRIDHTILKPDATAASVLAFCAEARQHGFCAVCINPVHVALAADALVGCAVRTCSVVGFPLGAMRPDIKAAETAGAIADGAQEIDMVIDIGALKDGRTDQVLFDITAVRAACSDAVLKVIIETCLLTDDEKRLACRLAEQAGADFVKTSTGFSTAGATPEDVRLMRATVSPTIGVKASGGIRTAEAAATMIAAGAGRIGTSSGVVMVRQEGVLF